MAFLHKSSGMLYLLDLSRVDWVNAVDGASVTQVLKRGDQWLRPPQTRELTDPKVELPRTMAELSGFNQGLHERLRYGYNDAWQQFIIARSQAAVASQPPPHPPIGNMLIDISTVASLKAPHAPLTFPAHPTFAPGAGRAPAFNTPPSSCAAPARRSSGRPLLLSPTCRLAHLKFSLEPLISLDAHLPRHSAVLSRRCHSKVRSSLPPPAHPRHALQLFSQYLD